MKEVIVDASLPVDDLLKLLASMGLPHGEAKNLALIIKEDFLVKAPRVYICSPLHTRTPEGVRRNMLAARAYVRAAETNCGVKGIAPHAYLPEFLDDLNPLERKLALRIGLGALEKCKALFVCGNVITDGMTEEIRQAARLNIPAVVFNLPLFSQVRKVRDIKASLGKCGDLALPPEMIWMSGEPAYDAVR